MFKLIKVCSVSFIKLHTRAFCRRSGRVKRHGQTINRSLEVVRVISTALHVPILTVLGSKKLLQCAATATCEKPVQRVEQTRKA
jgi:hypothetical protein